MRNSGVRPPVALFSASRPIFVRSNSFVASPSRNTSDVSLVSRMNSFVIGGSTIRNAWGTTTERSVRAWDMPSDRGRARPWW